MAAKLIITQGLPASGKSTWAKEKKAELEAKGQKCRIVTMDDIREAIGAVFEDGDENIVQGIRNYTINKYLLRGYTVISADTNLHPRTLEQIKQLAVEDGWEIQPFTHVPLDTCLSRNQVRWLQGDCKVPNQAIVKMHERYLAGA